MKERHVALCLFCFQVCCISEMFSGAGVRHQLLGARGVMSVGESRARLPTGGGCSPPCAREADLSREAVGRCTGEKEESPRPHWGVLARHGLCVIVLRRSAGKLFHIYPIEWYEKLYSDCAHHAQLVALDQYCSFSKISAK